MHIEFNTSHAVRFQPEPRADYAPEEVEPDRACSPLNGTYEVPSWYGAELFRFLDQNKGKDVLASIWAGVWHTIFVPRFMDVVDMGPGEDPDTMLLYFGR